MTEEDKYLEEYRSTMKKAVLSSKQKQDLISAMKEEQTRIRGSQTQERENRKRPSFFNRTWKPVLASGLALAMILLLTLTSFPDANRWVLPTPSASPNPDVRTADLTPLPNPASGETPVLNAGGLGTAGWYEQTVNPAASEAWPETLPVYRWHEAIEQRRLDPDDQENMLEKLEPFAKALQIDAQWTIGDIDPYLMNSSIWADTPWGRLDLVGSDQGELFVNGAISFSASSLDEAKAQIEQIVQSYSALFPIENPVIESIPVRTTEPQTTYTFIVYAREKAEGDRLSTSEARPITIYANKGGVQAIVYPLDTADWEADFPVLSLEEAIRAFETPAGYEAPQSDRIWRIWKSDATGTWLMPYYRFYVKSQTYDGYEAFDLCAIQPEYLKQAEK